MGAQDLLITPIFLLLIVVLAYFMRPVFTDRFTRKYFMPALALKLLGAIFLGIIYQFYYGGGDTFNYWTNGSQWIYKAFQDDFTVGLKLLFEEGGKRELGEAYQYSSRIWYYGDARSYLIVRIVAFFDLLTLGTYSASALFFAIYSFSGLWALFSVVQRLYPNERKKVAIALLFIPSVIFWGSGILKDTITLGSLGWLTWSLIRMIELRKVGILGIIIGLFSFLLIYKIKTYILLCFFPMVAVWLFVKNIQRFRNIVVRVLFIPVLFSVFAIAGVLSLNQISKGDTKYELDSIAERARITAYDIRYGWGARTEGDGGYDIGMPDGTWQSMLRLMPAAINVSLFRPFLWEVKNPLMLLAAIESMIIFILTIRLVIKKKFLSIFSDPFLVFCLGFSIFFAFAVGVSTFNFGTLMRYKIPFIPFYLLVLLVSPRNLTIKKKNLQKQSFQ